MGASPCFAMCGKQICWDHGCIRVYDQRPHFKPEPLTKVYVVFSYGDPMPITTCADAETAEHYAAALGMLPHDHPLYTSDAQVDEVPLNWSLPAPLAAVWRASATPTSTEVGSEKDVSA
jgi:hypothetical protein